MGSHITFADTVTSGLKSALVGTNAVDNQSLGNDCSISDLPSLLVSLKSPVLEDVAGAAPSSVAVESVSFGNERGEGGISSIVAACPLILVVGGSGAGSVIRSSLCQAVVLSLALDSVEIARSES